VAQRLEPVPFNIHPLGFLHVANKLEDFRAYVGFWGSFTNRAHVLSNFSAFEDLGALWEHACESIGNVLVPKDVYERFILAFDVLWVGGPVSPRARDAICEP